MKENTRDILKLQTEIIRKLTENNVKSLYDDIWGPSKDVEPIDGLPELPDLSDIGIDIPKKTKNTAIASNGKPKPEENTPPENIEDLKKELNEYIGLEAVKDEVKDLINLVSVQNMRKEHGLKVNDMSLHMVFSGNPGTGKTMVARLMSRIYKSLGILKKGHLVEVDRSGLVAGFVGQTAIKTSDVIQKAMGGVLFIDEAYALSNKQGNDFGQEAIDTLLKAMEDHRDEIIVIVAGYTELMEQFVNSNPGLKSRFNRFLYFEDYSNEELYDIFMLRCNKSGYILDDEASKALKTVLKKLNVPSFGNARGVRNFFEKIIVEQANRLSALKDITKDILMTITKEDILAASKEEKKEK